MSRFLENYLKKIEEKKVSDMIFYHVTSFKSLVSILKDNSFKGTTIHDVGDNVEGGTSISHSYKFAIDYSGGVADMAYNYYPNPKLANKFNYIPAIIVLTGLPEGKTIELEYNWIVGEKTGEYFIRGRLNNVSKYIKEIKIHPVFKNVCIDFLRENGLQKYKKLIVLDKKILSTYAPAKDIYQDIFG